MFKIYSGGGKQGKTILLIYVSLRFMVNMVSFLLNVFNVANTFLNHGLLLSCANDSLVTFTLFYQGVYAVAEQRGPGSTFTGSAVGVPIYIWLRAAIPPARPLCIWSLIYLYQYNTSIHFHQIAHSFHN